ncbi:unnamed protein product [Camellia sinensis]
MKKPFEGEACLAAKQIIAAGPFTTTDNLFFEPLTELLAYTQRKQPQLLLLLGPFIDYEHPEIKKGAVNRTFDEIFRLEILGRLQDYVEYMGSAARVILVPSIRDANHDFVFPHLLLIFSKPISNIRYAVGMICCEEEGRLKEKPVLLQSSLIIAAGPFTTTDNLFFEPLTELLAYAQRKQPQLLLLLGPFIDYEHPEIKKGAVNRTFDEIFRLEILGRLQDYVEYMGSAARVILVPSIRDANHDFVFPQPAFDIQQADLKHQIKVGCCTVDILKQLRGEEISRNPSGGSKQRMNRLANHLLSQHSFCPLYPPMEDTPVDFSLAPEALQIPCNLDILILSSDLAHFVKVLSIGDKNDGEEQAKCICVNPGRLARGEGAGFFVELNYGGSPDSTSASVISIWTLNYCV